MQHFCHCSSRRSVNEQLHSTVMNVRHRLIVIEWLEAKRYTCYVGCWEFLCSTDVLSVLALSFCEFYFRNNTLVNMNFCHVFWILENCNFLLQKWLMFFKFKMYWLILDSICGLVVRVPGCRSRGPGSDSRRYQIFREVVSLERGSLSLVSTVEKLLGKKVAAAV
jgi:hypothetical protein